MPSRLFHSLLVIMLMFIMVITACSPSATTMPATQPVTEVASDAIATMTTVFVEPTTTSTPVEPTSTPAPTATSAPKEPLSFVNPQKYSIEYTVSIKNQGFSPTDIRLYLPVPSEWDAQKDLTITQISPEPKSNEADKKSGNVMAYWKLSGTPKKNASENFTLQFSLTAYETITNIDPAAIQPYKTDSEEYKAYTKAEKYIEVGDPKIIQLADQLAGDETNPYLQAKTFYDYIVKNAHYKLLGKGLNGAKYLLDTGNGECGDYSALFIALSRAKGIPARPVVGYWAISGNDQTHVWAEFYLEGIGWIPVDATIGQQSADKNAYYFGNMDNQRVVLSKGYNTTLVPAGPDGYIAPILQVPMWWFWGNGDANKIKMDRSWTVSKVQ